MRDQKGIFTNIDWITFWLYLAMVLLGWISVYAAVYDESHSSILDMDVRYGKQLIWILAGLLIGLTILLIDAKFFSAFAWVIYGISIATLLAVLVFGTVISGSKSWFQVGGFAIQPSEFAKFATCLALAKYLSAFSKDISSVKTKIISSLIIFTPAIMVLMQHDTGSAIVYPALILVLFREGLSGSILLVLFFIGIIFFLTLLMDKLILIGILIVIAALVYYLSKKSRRKLMGIIGILVVTIGLVLSVNYAFNNFLEGHQQTRINVLLGKEVDPKGAGYNVHQSMIAIGSGGLLGKGFLKGTQTKYNFVPEQSTDFIFCTVGEEWGFAGSLVVIGLFLGLLSRLVILAERQRSAFSRIYGYGVASILFCHFAINIGMTIGLVPVIGIPLPFFSYGGSSLWAFTILLFIFLRQDANRLDIL